MIVEVLTSGIIGFALGILTGILSKIGFYEYKSWRERNIKKKKELEDFFKNVQTKCNEFVILWNEHYGKREDKILKPSIEKFRTDFDILSNQMNELKARAPKDVEIAILDILGKISIQIRDLSEHLFSLGGTSVREFNEKGDEIIQKIKILSSMMEKKHG